MSLVSLFCPAHRRSSFRGDPRAIFRSPLRAPSAGRRRVVRRRNLLRQSGYEFARAPAAALGEAGGSEWRRMKRNLWQKESSEMMLNSAHALDGGFHLACISNVVAPGGE